MKMTKPELNAVRFDAEDVIATSGPVTFTLSHLGNNIEGDAKFISSDGLLTYDNAVLVAGGQKWFYGYENALAAINQYTGKQFSRSNYIFEAKGSYFSAWDVFGEGDRADRVRDNLNGVYIWDAVATKFVWQTN